MKVLAVDDDPVARLIMEQALDRLGHACLTAQGGEAAWRLFVEQRPDLVISDWMMPDLDGLELCRRIRSAGGGRYCSFILVTSLDDRQDVREGMLAGVDDYLTKPLMVDDLEFRLMVAARLNALHTHLADQQRKLEALNEELKLTARVDALTGLGNRLRLAEDLAALVSRMERYREGCAVGALDIDRFKTYNDVYGHLQGDAVLKAVARVIASHIRGSDAAYRFGGEEFVRLFPAQSLDTAVCLVERIRRQVQALQIPHPSNPPHNVVTISGGVSVVGRGEPQNPERILESADRALYRAKSNGRNRVEAAALVSELAV